MNKPSEVVNNMICINLFKCTQSDIHYSKKAIKLLSEKLRKESVVLTTLPILSSVNIQKIKIELDKTLESLKDSVLYKYFKATCECFISQFNNLFISNSFITIPNVDDVLQVISE